METTSALEKLTAYFERPVAQAATAPLKEGTELAVILNGETHATLKKAAGKLTVSVGEAKRPDMTIRLSSRAVEELVRTQSDDIADTGIAIVRLMISSVPEQRIGVKVHIGGLQFLTHGYLGILPLGGKRLMQFLAEKGVSSIGKIKDIIAGMR